MSLISNSRFLFKSPNGWSKWKEYVTCDDPEHKGERRRSIFSSQFKKSPDSLYICKKCYARKVGRNNIGRTGFKHTDESKKKISLKNSGAGNGMVKMKKWRERIGVKRLPTKVIERDKIFATRAREEIRKMRHQTTNIFNPVLGYDTKQFRERIESTWEIWMNWGNFGNKNGWSVDHIVPIKQFIKMGIYDFKRVNDLRNLRALSRRENSKKNATSMRQSLIHWLLD